MAKEISVRIFRIIGSFKQRRQTTPFSREILAVTEENAKNKLYADLGSKNRLNRRQIKIQKVLEIQREDITDPLIEKILNSEFKIPFED